MKKGYLAYVVYNLMDGHDFSSVGVFDDLDIAVDAIHKEMVDNEDDELIPEMTGTDTVYKDEDRSYNIEEINIYLLPKNTKD